MALGAAIVLWAAAQSPEPPPEPMHYGDPQAYGLPARLTSLTDLAPVLDRKDLNPAQKTEVLVCWLAGERAQPSPTTKGLGGGDIDTGYIQSQVVKALAEAGDPLELTQLGGDERADASIRMAARLGLSLMGDRRWVPELRQTLASHQEWQFRWLAAQALGSLGATEAAADLEAALQDGFHAEAASSVAGAYTAYPVREAAETALRVFASPAAMAASKERCEAFDRRLAEAVATAQGGSAEK